MPTIEQVREFNNFVKQKLIKEDLFNTIDIIRSFDFSNSDRVAIRIADLFFACETFADFTQQEIAYYYHVPAQMRSECLVSQEQINFKNFYLSMFCLQYLEIETGEEYVPSQLNDALEILGLPMLPYLADDPAENAQFCRAVLSELGKTLDCELKGLAYQSPDCIMMLNP